MTNQAQSDKASRKLARAIKLVPRSQRERYTQEWRADLAASKPHERDHVARAALAMGCRLRLRDIGTLLLGGHGAGKATVWWVIIIAFVVLWPFFPFVFVSLCVFFVFFSLLYVGAPSRFSHWLMVVSGALFLGATGFSMWSFVTQINAADRGEDKSFLAPWTEGAFAVIAISTCLFVVGSILALRREKSL
ncbi:MAG: hypothetical protein Q4B02_14380 [Propionibacteriaceae bacterium]|nr:hypothetical protein [Propionibacteriaceae bacterium]